MVLVSEVDCVSVSLSCQCSIEWFHFACVGLTTKPRGKWYVPQFWSCLLLFRVLPLQFGKRTPLLYVLDSIINLFSPCHYPPSLSICRYCPRCSQERKKKWVPWSEKRWREKEKKQTQKEMGKWRKRGPVPSAYTNIELLSALFGVCLHGLCSLLPPLGRASRGVVTVVA